MSGSRAGSLDYRAAGVDIDAGEDAKNRMRALVESTYTAGVRGEFGAFGGAFQLPPSDTGTRLVASADGVGTKLKVAIAMNRHDTIGHDLVNHCVNDILVLGARPLFFLDYVAFGKLVPDTVEQIVAGIAAGCRENGCALVGGETAEMPGVYTPPDYDLAGFIVGCVDDPENAPGPSRVQQGDVLVALASNGLHTNGYSLARRIVDERVGGGLNAPVPVLDARFGDALLAVHSSYLAAVAPVMAELHALAHITGGGLPGNLDRALPPDCDAYVDRTSWDVPPLFKALQSAGNVPDQDMFRTFNMGVGMVMITPRERAESVIASAARAGIAGWITGYVRPGSGRVVLSA